jgi:nitrilase
MSHIAIVQTTSVFLDKQKTIDKAVAKIEQAAANGARLVIFTEAFIPGYPAWIWRLRPGADWNSCEALHQRLYDNSVNIDANDLAPLYQAAKEFQLTIVCGMVEKDSRPGSGTLYNSVVTIGPDGSLLNRHRKLMPTNPERMVWGFGDASGLKTIDTPCGSLGSLICWENYMPLARYALYAQGVELYIAPTYDSSDDWISSLQHIAREACCWVIGSGNLMRGSDMPDDLPQRAQLYPDAVEWVNPGDSVVIEPGGKIVAGPLRQEDGILYHSVDPALASSAKRALDVSGHYARPDVFQLQVNAKIQTPLEITA